MNKKTNIIWLIPIFITIFVFSIFPIIISLFDAFISDDGKFTLKYFSKVFNDPLFVKSLINSIFYSFTTFISIGLAIYISITIIGISNKYLKSSLSIIIFLQYMFLSLAISTGYIYLFRTNYGIINIFLSLFNVKNISFLNDVRYSVLTICFINIITSLPFLVTSFSYKGLTYLRKKEILIKSNNININDWVISKSIILNMINFILLLFYFSLVQNFLLYPIGLYSGDLSAIFVAESQTLVCYINRAISLGNYNNAAVCSLISLTFILFFTIIFTIIYYKIRKYKND